MKQIRISKRDGSKMCKIKLFNILPIQSRSVWISLHMVVALLILLSINDDKNNFIISKVEAKLADRSRLVKHRKEVSDAASNMNSRLHTSHGVTKSTKPDSIRKDLPIDGNSYRRNKIDSFNKALETPKPSWRNPGWKLDLKDVNKDSEKRLNEIHETLYEDEDIETPFDEDEDRRELSQLTGCCETYADFKSYKLCYKYGQDCSTGQEPSHDSGDADCSQAGLSFIGISFSVNTAHGNPYSYQLCDQYAMENIIDRDYNYIMSMDEDGWLVGGGYKSFDYSGKMPYIDSSHTELLRIGSLDPEYGGTSIEQVYNAMESISFPPFSVFPEFVKGGGGGSHDDETVPSSDVTLIVSIVDEYSENNGNSDYEIFLDDLFDAMDAVGGGPCMDDHDTDPHVSMSRGVKFKTSYHESQYFWTANLEVAVWQAMYPNGVIIGSTAKAAFPPNKAGKNRKTVGYGNLYFFFDRANITKAFAPNRDMSDDEYYYATMYSKGYSTEFYEKVTTVDFDYSGSHSNDNEYYEHNPYSWNAKMAKHDMTDGWDLPPNCNQEGEAFFGIPFSRNSDSKLTSTSSFQNQFDFECLLDRNFTYMKEFGTNHGWLVGEQIGNGAGSIVDKDTAHIPLFYLGTTNPDMGGISLSDMVKLAKKIEFGTLYVKPAFVFQDDDGSIKLQFEADANSALGYLYDNLCKMIGIAWNYDSPSNDLGIFTNCAMHAAGDRAAYGCGPDNANVGGFCPQMTLAYRVSFQSEDLAASFLKRGNTYVQYWRELYPSGVAVGTDRFCPGGGCLGLFLNRYDLFNVFKPELGGSWVEYNGATSAPTISPAPSFHGGCDDPRNFHLDKCFRRSHQRRSSAVVWDSLGAIGQLSVLLVMFMSSTLAASLFFTRARRRKAVGESYIAFFMRDMKRKKKKTLKKKKSKRKKISDLEDDILAGDTLHSEMMTSSGRRGRSRSKSRGRSRSKGRRRSISRGKSEKSLKSDKSERTGKSKSSKKSKKVKSDRSRSRSKSARKKSEKDKSFRRQLV